MVKRSIAYLLLLSLMAPLNSGAAAWMSLSMSEQGDSFPVQSSMTANGLKTSPSDDHRHTNHLIHGGGDSNAQPHESAHASDRHRSTHSQNMHGDETPRDHYGAGKLHNTHTKADCESECSSCTNHCTTLALLSQSCDSESKNLSPASSLAHPLSSLAELLLRPPILV